MTSCLLSMGCKEDTEMAAATGNVTAICNQKTVGGTLRTVEPTLALPPAPRGHIFYALHSVISFKAVLGLATREWIQRYRGA